jgi:hypothetical protein
MALAAETKRFHCLYLIAKQLPFASTISCGLTVVPQRVTIVILEFRTTKVRGCDNADHQLYSTKTLLRSYIMELVMGSSAQRLFWVFVRSNPVPTTTMHNIASFLALSLFTLASATSVDADVDIQSKSTKHVAAAWYAGWHATNFPLSDVSWEKYTHMTYAFAITTPDVYNLSLSQDDETLLPQFVKAAHKHVCPCCTL